MAVEYRTNFRTFFHDRQVQKDFARTFARSGNLIPFHIDNAKVLRFHKAFANLGRGAHDPIFIDSVANITVVRGGKSSVIQSATDVANLVFYLMQIEHALVLLYTKPRTPSA